MGIINVISHIETCHFIINRLYSISFFTSDSDQMGLAIRMVDPIKDSIAPSAASWTVLVANYPSL
nr:hypothetical protein Itr_chr01CG02890 [Ipomoea trifida]